MLTHFEVELCLPGLGDGEHEVQVFLSNMALYDLPFLSRVHRSEGLQAWQPVFDAAYSVVRR